MIDEDFSQHGSDNIKLIHFGQHFLSKKPVVVGKFYHLLTLHPSGITPLFSNFWAPFRKSIQD